MKTYIYRARLKDGQSIESRLNAESPEQLQQILISGGRTPVWIREPNLWDRIKYAGILKSRPKLSDKILFARELQAMVSAGASLEHALRSLAKHRKHKGFKDAILKTLGMLQSGSSLSGAMQEFPWIFDSQFTAFIKIGESGGNLEETLEYACTLMEKSHKRKEQTKTVWFYFGGISLLMAGIIIFFSFYLLPQFIDVIKRFQAEKKEIVFPFFTRFYLELSQYLVQYWYLALLLLALIFIGFRILRLSENARMIFGKISFHMPLFGKLNILYENVYFAYLFASLYRLGVLVQTGLELSRQSAENPVFSKEIEQLRQLLIEGNSFGQAMEKSRYFMPSIQEALIVGSDTGQMHKSLTAVARVYEILGDQQSARIQQMLQPIMTVFFGAITLTILLALFLPIFTLYEAIK